VPRCMCGRWRQGTAVAHGGINLRLSVALHLTWYETTSQHTDWRPAVLRAKTGALGSDLPDLLALSTASRIRCFREHTKQGETPVVLHAAGRLSRP
jgi:hypothetical protein